MLTLRDLNRATLARQMVLARATLPALEALRRLVCLQAQLPDPPYVGLWTRLVDFEHDELTSLMECRRVVRATLMRATLHLMAADDYLAFRNALQPALSRALRGFFGARAAGLEVEGVVAEARTLLEERPRTFAELRDLLGPRFPARDREAIGYTVRTHLAVVQVPPAGTWGVAGNPAYALAEPWLEGLCTPSEEGLPVLVRRYLAAFGPATAADFGAWAGMGGARPIFESLRPGLATFRDDRGREMFDLPDAPRPSGDDPAPVRFLPDYDSLLLAHDDRRRVFADDVRPRVFPSGGRVRATFLVDGFVAGAWRVERKKGSATLVLEPFGRLESEVRQTLAAEAERLVRFVARGAATLDLRVESLEE